MTFLDDFDGLDKNNRERIRPEIKNLIKRGNITVAEHEEIRCNSWEREALVPALNDEAFVKQMRRALDNCFTTRDRPFTTYNQAVEGLYAPELLERFAASTRDAKTFAGVLDAVREALGQKVTHYLLIAGHVKELVEAVESRSDAVRVLRGIREDGDIEVSKGFINNCALANLDDEKNCQVCFGQCPDRDRFEVTQ